MAEEAGLVLTPFTIDKNSNGSTWLTADLADVTTYTTILTYAVPLGVAIQITVNNYHFGDYRATDTTTQITAGQSRVLKENASATDTRELWAGPNNIFKDIGDRFQRPYFQVGVTVNASEKLIAQILNHGTTLDSVASNYYFEAVQYSNAI